MPVDATKSNARRILPLAVGLSAVVAAVALAVTWRRPVQRLEATTPEAEHPTFVGGEACMRCHPEQYDLWMQSDHARAMQPATGATVLGDFENARFTKDGVTSTFLRRDGRFVVRTDGPDGVLREYDVAYTFGVDSLQQYLVPFPRGRYQALGIAWDTRPAAAGGQRWFHLYPDERVDHRDALHWTGPLQSWSYMCGDCHSTNLRLDYRLAEDAFAPTWTDVAVSCEACHGPGSEHVAWAERARRDPGPTPAPSEVSAMARPIIDHEPTPDPLRGLAFALRDTSGGRWVLAEGERIAHRTRPPASRVEVETCAPCHARRAPIWGERRPGEPLEQTHRTALLEDPLYFADGQIRDEVYEHGSFLQSRMYQAGVTCSDCHEPHGAGLRETGNALCARCHLPAAYDGPQHHFHDAGTEAAACVSCHMARRLYMVVDGRRDHGFRVPRPDLAEKLGAPDACRQCHDDRPARWAADAVARWYGPGRRQGWHWAEAIHAGRTWRIDAGRQLVRAVEDPAVPAIARATALSLLPPYLGPGSLGAVEASARDPDPLVRRAAAAVLASLEPSRRIARGASLLDDPIRSVRFEALSSLLDVPRAAFTSAALAALDRVAGEYRRAQASLADRAESHLNLGALDARLGNLDRAEAAYRTAIRLQPAFVAAYVNLADLYHREGREDAVVATLEEALGGDPEAAELHEAMGLSLVRQGRLRDAIPRLEAAARLGDDVPRYAYVHAVALHEAGERRRALDVLASASRRYPAHRDTLVALVAYHRDAGDREAAAAWARKLVELRPSDEGALAVLRELEQANPGAP